MDQREQLAREANKGRTESLLKLVQRIRDRGVAVLSDITLPVGDMIWVARWGIRGREPQNALMAAAGASEPEPIDGALSMVAVL
jgi:hypothetical protein